MQKNIYRDILSQSWKIAIENKVLWIFGLFAALLGNGGEFQILIKVSDLFNYGSGQLSQINSIGVAHKSWLDLFALSIHSPFEFFLLLMTAMTVLVLVGFLIWAVIMSQIALIEGIERKIAKKKMEFNLRNNEQFNTVLAINIILRMAVFLLFFILGMPLFFAAISLKNSVSIFILLALFVLLVGALVIVSFIAKFAIAFCVLKKSALLSSIESAFHLFRQNWIISLEMAFILFAVNFVAGLFGIVLIAFISMPMLAMSSLYIVSGFSMGAWVMIFLMLLIDFTLIGFIGAFLATFQWTNWIVLFQNLTSRRNILSKVERVITSVPRYLKNRFKAS